MVAGVFGARGVYAVPRVVLVYNAVTVHATRRGPRRTGTRASGRVRRTKFAPISNAMVRNDVCLERNSFGKMHT